MSVTRRYHPLPSPSSQSLLGHMHHLVSPSTRGRQMTPKWHPNGTIITPPAYRSLQKDRRRVTRPLGSADKSTGLPLLQAAVSPRSPPRVWLLHLNHNSRILESQHEGNCILHRRRVRKASTRPNPVRGLTPRHQAQHSRMRRTPTVSTWTRSSGHDPLLMPRQAAQAAPVVARPRNASRQSPSWSTQSPNTAAMSSARPDSASRTVSRGLGWVMMTQTRRVDAGYCRIRHLAMRLHNGRLCRHKDGDDLPNGTLPGLYDGVSLYHHCGLSGDDGNLKRVMLGQPGS